MKMGITMFVSLYTTRLVLNALGVDDFGIFGMVAGVIAMLAFLNASMAAATQRFMSYAEGEGNREKQRIIFNISVVLHLAIAVVVAILLYAAAPFLFGHFLNIPEGRIFAARCVYWAMIASTVFSMLGVPYEAMLNAHENMLGHVAGPVQFSETGGRPACRSRAGGQADPVRGSDGRDFHPRHDGHACLLP